MTDTPTRIDEALGTYSEWAYGFDADDLRKRLTDQARIKAAQLKDGNEHTRTTPAGLTEAHYDTLRSGRDDLDYREWNTESAFNGKSRTPTGPGVPESGTAAGERKRRARTAEVDDGF